MVRIALTGAAGKIGREVVDAFGDEHAVTPFVHSQRDDLEADRLELTDAEQVLAKLDGFDVVVHLAGASSPRADWETVSEVNVQGTKHVFDAAVENGVDRVVFASSNHVVGTATPKADGSGSDAVEGETLLRADAPAAPDSYYGVSKAAGEGLGKYYAAEHGIEVVNLRIGWYMDEAELRRNTAEDRQSQRRYSARAIWLSPRDCRDVHRKAATADLPRRTVTVNALSRNDDRYFTITEAMRALGYEPRDNSAEVLDE